MDAELDKLHIDRAFKRSDGPSPWGKRVIIAGVVLGVLLGAAYLLWRTVNQAVEVEVQRVQVTARRTAEVGSVLLHATGYIVAAHKIQVAPKVNGRVAQVLVDKGHQVQQGQVLVRLEDDEYRAQLQQAGGQLQTAQARLQEALHGARPEEIGASAGQCGGGASRPRERAPPTGAHAAATGQRHGGAGGAGRRPGPP